MVLILVLTEVFVNAQLRHRLPSGWCHNDVTCWADDSAILSKNVKRRRRALYVLWYYYWWWQPKRIH